MNPGTLIAFGEHVAVVIRMERATVRACIWIHRTGRWMQPKDLAHEKVAQIIKVAGEHADNPVAQAALENIRRHHGLIPYGGTTTRYVRVWPEGQEP